MSSPFTVPILRATRGVIRNKYNVSLKDNASLRSHLRWLQQQKLKSGDGSSECKVLYKHKFINAYTAVLIGPILEDLAKRDDVKSISESGMIVWENF
ncbi:unnamed protein product [Rhizoctonia solani]|uniref:Inhibitor I9 domain-containing protein n=1 Tax=Rhizoctonia solani TaxID=456999 RepID=A0A8H3HLJ2_9AGAM|nr:unnamed protein product [Rhizoctonia solani]